jgi:hypothetical protein
MNELQLTRESLNKEISNIKNTALPEIIQSLNAFGIRAGSDYMDEQFTVGQFLLPMRAIRQVQVQILSIMGHVDEFIKINKDQWTQQHSVVLNGALRRAKTFIKKFEAIKKNHDLPKDLTVEHYEDEEAKYQLMKCFNQSLGDVMSGAGAGFVSKGDLDFAWQTGISFAEVSVEANNFISKFEKKRPFTWSEQWNWLNEMAAKYKDRYIEAEKIKGFYDTTSK